MSLIEPIIGIDLGTTNCLVGVMDAGFSVLIPDEEGRRLLPSVVSWPEIQAEPLVGHAARRARSLAPDLTIASSKRFMGRRWSDLEENDLCQGDRVSADGQGMVTMQIRASGMLKKISPKEVAAILLERLAAQAGRYLEQPVRKAVITVPAYFNDLQRQATKEAGELAGLDVVRILSEPTAAALAYGVDRQHRQAKIAVYDLGGGTFDLSILELNEGIFQVLATSGNTRLGGDDIDAALYHFLLEKIPEKIQGSLDHIARARLREESEQAKIRLSAHESTGIELPFLTPEYSFQYNLTRTELDKVSRPLLEQTRKHCLRALQDAGLQPSDLQDVLLVGGQTRMPLVRLLVKEWLGHEPNITLDPDEAVARGAVIQAGILSGAVQNMVLLDITPLSLGLETFGGLMNVIIPRNSTIPTKAGELFTNAVDNQSLMKLRILQGERELAKDNWLLGELDLEFQPGPRATARVGVQFDLDADGILHVLARDTISQKEKQVQIRSVVDVSDEKVEQMVSESVEYALEDMQERQWIESDLKAKRLMELTHKALLTARTEVGSEIRIPVEKALEKLEQSLQQRRLSELKQSMRALDEVSKPLADFLMDKALEASLRRKGVL
jgi:molecular chaperone DnaK